LLVARGLVASRTLAQALILAGQVRTGPDSVVAKPSQMLPRDAFLQIAQPPRFVGRGGEKLEAFLEKFALDARGLHALDIGASTGGFTDCLLQRGAADVTCVDVGHGQLHAKLRSDKRVTNLEKVNARELEKISLPRDNYDLVVIDVSFISLSKILPPTWARVRAQGHYPRRGDSIARGGNHKRIRGDEFARRKTFWRNGIADYRWGWKPRVFGGVGEVNTLISTQIMIFRQYRYFLAA
jgi:TlyA family rRNA methyltransferase/putative hemolysin